MPRTANYRANSVIYFEGDRDEQVYILKSGRVVLSSTDIETNEVVRNTVEIGEFFGVKAALGHYPREEDAMVLMDSVVVVLSVPEFEQLALNNSQIVIKMLKVFSHQLRRLHTKVQSMLNENLTTIDAEAGLFQCVEYYMSNQSYESATHALTRYLQYYPNHVHAQHARRYLHEANAALGNAMTDFSVQQPVAPPPPPSSVTAPPLPTASAPRVSFQTAKHLFDTGKFEDAQQQFWEILDGTQDSGEKQNIILYIGRCQLDSGQHSECVRTFTQMLQDYTDVNDVDLVLYYIGHAYYLMGNQQKANAFLQRTLQITERGVSFKELVQQDLVGE